MADQLTPRASGLRRSDCENAEHQCAGEGRRRFRLLLLQQPPVRALAVFVHGGQLPSKLGAYDNAAEFPARIPTFAHYLRSAGYQTALSGKMHFCGARSAARLRGAADHGYLSGGFWLDPGLAAF